MPVPLRRPALPNGTTLGQRDREPLCQFSADLVLESWLSWVCRKGRLLALMFVRILNRCLDVWEVISVVEFGNRFMRLPGERGRDWEGRASDALPGPGGRQGLVICPAKYVAIFLRRLTTAYVDGNALGISILHSALLSRTKRGVSNAINTWK